MTSTAQLVREAMITEQKSLVLVRNLLRTTLSSICYLRNLFPEDCFTDRNLEGINIKSLVPKDGEDSGVLINWLEKGVFEALEKHFLHSMIFAVTERDPAKQTDPNDDCGVLESYTFEFSFPNNQPEVKVVQKGRGEKPQENRLDTSIEGVKRATVSALRSVITVAQTLSPLPDERYLTMRLFYTDQTPEDYQPSYFTDATNMPLPTSLQNPFKCKLGEVRTEHHGLKLKMKSLCAEDLAMDAVKKDEKTPKPANKEPTTKPDEQNSNPSELLELMRQFVLSDSAVENDGNDNSTITTNAIRAKFPSADAPSIKRHLMSLTKEGVLKPAGTNKFVITSKQKDSLEQQIAREAEDLKEQVISFLATREVANLDELTLQLDIPGTVLKPLLQKLFKDGYLGTIQRSSKSSGRFGGGRRVLEKCREHAARKTPKTTQIDNSTSTQVVPNIEPAKATTTEPTRAHESDDESSQHTAVTASTSSDYIQPPPPAKKFERQGRKRTRGEPNAHQIFDMDDISECNSSEELSQDSDYSDAKKPAAKRRKQSRPAQLAIVGRNGQQRK